MKCIIFSDSHKNSFYMKKALNMHPDAEIVFFLGDGLDDIDEIYTLYPNVKFLAVRGNCDHMGIAMGTMVPKTDSIMLLGKRITYTHGDLYGVKYGSAGVENLAEKTLSDIVLFGHTHTPFFKYVSDKTDFENSNIKEEKIDKNPDGEADETYEYFKPFYLFNPGSIGNTYPKTFGLLTLEEGKEPLLSHGKLF